MKRVVVGMMTGVLALALGSGGCAADTPGPACDPSGNWRDTSKRTGGNCDARPNQDNPGTFTMRQDAAGRWLLNLENLGDCPGTMSADCRFVATCEYFVLDTVTKQPDLAARFSVDYTFAGASLTGSQTATLFPPAVAKMCQVIYTASGSRL